MIDDTPLTFAEAIEICRSRPIGYAGTEVVGFGRHSVSDSGPAAGCEGDRCVCLAGG